MQSLIGQEQGGALVFGQAGVHKIKVILFIAAIQFVANDRESEVGQMDANLVFPTRQRPHGKQREVLAATLEGPHQAELCLCGRAILPNAILDHHRALQIASKWCVDDPAGRFNLPVDDGQIALFHPAIFPQPTAFERGPGVFRHQNQSARLAIKAVD